VQNRKAKEERKIAVEEQTGLKVRDEHLGVLTCLEETGGGGPATA